MTSDEWFHSWEPQEEKNANLRAHIFITAPLGDDVNSNGAVRSSADTYRTQVVEREVNLPKLSALNACITFNDFIFYRARVAVCEARWIRMLFFWSTFQGFMSQRLMAHGNCMVYNEANSDQLMVISVWHKLTPFSGDQTIRLGLTVLVKSPEFKHISKLSMTIDQLDSTPSLPEYRDARLTEHRFYKFNLDQIIIMIRDCPLERGLYFENSQYHKFVCLSEFKREVL